MNVGSLIVVTNCHWSLLSPLTERFSRATKMSPPLTVPPPSLPVATSILLLPLPLLPAILSYPPLTRLPLSQNWGRLDKVSPKTFHSLRRIVFECNLPLLEIVASNDDGEWNMLRECASIRAINFGGGKKKKKKIKAGWLARYIPVRPASRLTVLFGPRAISVKFHPPGGVA